MYALLVQREVDWMNINRTFSLPVSTAMKLKAERNQSRTVTRAVNKYLDEKDAFELGDIPIRRLMAALQARPECSDQLKAILLVELNQK
tara:strand:- start:40 stop:306 length:267 start_codon:yes stop_codon:yes gene_type:complete